MNIQQFIDQNRLLQADVIVLKKKFFGMVDHFAVFLGYDRQTGTPLFAANYTRGTKLIHPEEIQQFMTQLNPERIERFQGTLQQRYEAIERALSRLGSDDYDYLKNNCEHYKNFVQTGIHHSTQADNFSKGLVIVGLAAIFGAILDQR